ncbi:diphthine--ammonia ligase [Protopterus annectens]|uniref:diphthine--ammonia ligase n=1 Tax=Protopterus annectens TaxID=7888 RepID=UPI001CFA612A|nr:diphthine--ammonia ligase [Protopterus annectens]
MKVVALISGGKDSCYNMVQCVAAGHQIVALANLRPSAQKDELDSYMYQTVGHQAIDIYAEAMSLPLYRRTIQGASLETGSVYNRCDEDEVEDLYHLLKRVKEKEEVEAVSVGAILSDYQRVRVENVCKRLNLQPLAYLWRRSQEDLLTEMISANIQAMIIKVAAFGLDPDKHLRKTLLEMEPYLKELSEKYGVHICGEGGEYETFTLDCPLFKKRIVVDESEVVIHSADAFAPVGYLNLSRLHLEDKVTDNISFLVPSSICPCLSSLGTNPDFEEMEDFCGCISPKVDWRVKDDGHHITRPSLCTKKTIHGYQWISGVTASCTHMEKEVIIQEIKQAFSILQEALESTEFEFKDIVLVNLYVRRMNDFELINSVYQTYFDVNPPARVCVEAPLFDGILFQADCLVHKHEMMNNDNVRHEKQVMHVQSISHWAPANIGPYSQAVKVEDVIYCAGQIALVPCTMKLVAGGIRAEAVLSLNHVEKVLNAMSEHTSLNHIMLAICYVTNKKDIPTVQKLWCRKLKEHATQVTEYGEPSVTHGPLVVAVVPHLPRDASVEWHVVAMNDDPTQRKFISMAGKLQGCKIDCEAVGSSSMSSVALSVSLSLTSQLMASVALDSMLHELSSVMLTAVKELSQDDNLTLLCCRTFYIKDCISGHSLLTGLEEFLKELLGPKSPALILVPVTDLPDLQILHVACWLSL